MAQHPSRGIVVPWLTGITTWTQLLQFHHGAAAGARAPGYPHYGRLFYHHYRAFMPVVKGF
jgi:hypothetical protein